MKQPLGVKGKDDDFVRTVLIAAICVPVIGWLIYSGYQKHQESGPKTSACRQECSAKGAPGYDFQWPMFGPPKCTCLGPSK